MAHRRSGLAAAVVVVTACWCATAQARDAVVTSFDGTRIVAHFFPSGSAAPGQRVPTVLVGAPFGLPGQTDGARDGGDRIGVATLRRNGYNVLTWDPRGFGGSGGTSMFDSVDFEARDVRALIDFVAQQPEALLDAPDDPRVGMSGTSYGGAIQLVTAAIEPRVDAIIPDLAWHSLSTSLFKEDSVKVGWLTPICVNGEALGLAGGVASSAGLQLGSVDEHFLGACARATALGSVSATDARWFADRGPGALVNRIRAPALIMQGTFDTLFTLGQAIANYDALRRNGVPVRMLWYCGGHGTCRTTAADLTQLADAGLRWFARWLKRDRSTVTGQRFEWFADDGIARSGPDYPLASAGTLKAAGSGSLAIIPSVNVALGGVTIGTPATGWVDARFRAPKHAADIVGKPALRLRYRGTARPASTLLYAQIYDVGAGRAVGDQLTPIRLVLDGRTRTLEHRLAAIAVHRDRKTKLRLRITSAGALYGHQLSLGRVRLRRIRATLPLVVATRSASTDAG